MAISLLMPSSLCSDMLSLPYTVMMVAEPLDVAPLSSGISPMARRQMSRRSPSFPAEYMGAPAGFTARPVRRGSGYVSTMHGEVWQVHTAMRSLGRPEDGRLARLPHIRSLGLSREQQRVSVGISGVVYDPAEKAENAEGDEGRVHVPACQKLGNGAVQLVE
jgi:hypothetical protein